MQKKFLIKDISFIQQVKIIVITIFWYQNWQVIKSFK